MNTLIIHPKDRSTDFLYPIYRDIPNKTVVTGQVTKDEIIELIGLHKQVIMLGHGSPDGLFGVGQFQGQGSYIIDHTMVDILKEKNNSIFIWCNADKFVDGHELNGLYSGMFISELGEAYYCGVKAHEQHVHESNGEFAYLLGRQLISESSLEITYDVVSKGYRALGNTNPVAKYNSKRWYYAVD
jgi:hypothetical protein